MWDLSQYENLSQKNYQMLSHTNQIMSYQAYEKTDTHTYHDSILVQKPLQ